MWNLGIQTIAGGYDRTGIFKFARMRKEDIELEIRMRDRRDRAGDSNLLECVRERSHGRIDLTLGSNLTLDSDITLGLNLTLGLVLILGSNLTLGSDLTLRSDLTLGSDLTLDSDLGSNLTLGLGLILGSNTGGIDHAGNSNSLECGREISSNDSNSLKCVS